MNKYFLTKNKMNIQITYTISAPRYSIESLGKNNVVINSSLNKVTQANLLNNYLNNTLVSCLNVIKKALPAHLFFVPLVSREHPLVSREQSLVSRELPFVSRAVPLIPRAVPLIPRAVPLIPREDSLVSREDSLVSRELPFVSKAGSMIQKIVKIGLFFATIKSRNALITLKF